MQRLSPYSGALRPYTTLALCDEALALRLVAMPFLEVEDGSDIDVLNVLARLSDFDVSDVDEVLSHPLLRDGITDIGRSIVLLQVLEYDNPEAAEMIQAISLTQEVSREAALGANDIQVTRAPLGHYTVYALVEMAYQSPEALRELLRLPWVQNHQVQIESWVTGSRRTVTSWMHGTMILIRHIAQKSDTVMAEILRMPFLQSIEPHDEHILDVLWGTSDAGASSTDGETPLRQLLSDPALQDRITDDSIGHLALADLRVRAPEAYSALENLSWIRDGLSLSENAGVWSLWKAANSNTDMFQSMVSQKWVTDGLTLDESSAILVLEQMAIEARYLAETEGYPWHLEYVLTIPEKPFMRDVGASSVALLRSAQQILQQGGMGARPDLLSAILESGETKIEKRLITLPLAGEVALSVVWPSGLEPDQVLRSRVSASHTMALLEEAVRAAEEVMGLPFPQRSAVVLIHDFPGGGPPAHGGREAFVFVNPSVSGSTHIIRHEVAHAYWAAGSRWVEEGAAEFISYWGADNVSGYVSPSCLHFETIYEFVRALQLDGLYQYDRCAYSMGLGIFTELHNSLGMEAFRHGFSGLNLRRWGFLPSEGCLGIDQAACQLKAAFVDGLAPAEAAIAEQIINRRYYGTSP